MPTLPALLRALVVTAACGVGSLHAQSLAHAYYFNGNLNDSVGAATLTNPYGGSLATTTGYYTFGAGQGLGFVGEVGLRTDYTIALRFSFNSLGSYQRIIDFSNLGSDVVMYSLGTSLSFYPAASGGTLTANTSADFILTRSSSTGTVSGYLGTTLVFSFQDTSNYAVASAIANQSTLWFFRDDGGENAAGRVDSLVIYDGALTGTQISSGMVTSALTAIPEPATVALWMGAAGLAGAVVWRRRRV